MKGNIKWIAIFAAVCAACAAVWLIGKAATSGQQSAVARVMQNGKVIREINLNSVTEPYEFEIKDENGGSNTVRVEPGRIAVIDADCPDKICIKRGFIDNGALPIVCLPHRLSITVSGSGEYDAVAGDN